MKIINTNDKNFKNIQELIHRGKIIAHYHGIYDLNNRNLNKYEALCRIKYNNDIINPFKEFGEKHTPEIYKIIFTSMLKQTVNCLKNNKNYTISINMTKHDIFNYNLIKMIKNETKSVGDRIIFEITEGDEFDDNEIEKLITIMSNIRKDTSCKFALDDFGSGYSNLINIAKIKFDFIKFDSSLIKKVTKDRRTEFIVSNLTTLFHDLGSKVIAEFVETDEVERLLALIHIDFAQGNKYGDPKVIT